MEIEEIYREFLAGDGVSIDTRTLRPNQIFFALEGSNVNGNSFAREAIDKGARLAIVEGSGIAGGPKFIQVQSSLDTLQQLATFHRHQLNIPVLGITGSVGKTTTKELIQAVMSSRFNSYCTPGNLNNHIGVPLTVLSIHRGVEFAIVEMGANHIGEIELLCSIAKPTHGIITAIGKAHLEGFGSLEGVIIAKSDLYRWLQKHQGTAFINEADELLLAVSKGFEMEKIYIHQRLATELLAADPFLKLKINFPGGPATLLNTRVPGKYNVPNIEAAICIGQYFDVPLDNIKTAIESYEGKSNRSQWARFQDNTFILDAYNANPVSMEAAIRSFAELNTGDKKGLILGEMKELGEVSPKEHQHIIDLIGQFSWDMVILVGKPFSAAGKRSRYFYFDEVAELKAWYSKQEFKNHTFLVKGSRGVALEKLFQDDLVSPGSAH